MAKPAEARALSSSQARTASVYALLTMTFLGDFGLGAALSVQSLYVTSFLGSASVVGLLMACFGIARVISNLPAGFLSERYGRKPVMMVGSVLRAMAVAAFALSRSFLPMAVFMFLSGVGGALRWTTLLAAAGDASGGGQRGRVMSMVQASSMIGIIGGPALGGFLGQRFSLSAPFFFSAFADTLSILVLMLVFRETDRKMADSTSPQARATTNLWRIPAFWLIAWVSFGNLFTGIGSRVTILPLYASQALGMNPAQIGLTGSLGSLAMLAAVPIAARYIDTRARTVLVSGALGASALFLIATSRSGSVGMLLLFTSLQSFASGLLMPAPSAITADIVQGENLGPAMGALQTVSEIGWLAGPLALGVIADTAGNYRAPFLANALLLALLAGLVGVFMKPKK